MSICQKKTTLLWDTYHDRDIWLNFISISVRAIQMRAGKCVIKIKCCLGKFVLKDIGEITLLLTRMINTGVLITMYWIYTFPRIHFKTNDIPRSVYDVRYTAFQDDMRVSGWYLGRYGTTQCIKFCISYN